MQTSHSTLLVLAMEYARKRGEERKKIVDKFDLDSYYFMGGAFGADDFRGHAVVQRQDKTITVARCRSALNKLVGAGGLWTRERIGSRGVLYFVPLPEEVADRVDENTARGRRIDACENFINKVAEHHLEIAKEMEPINAGHFVKVPVELIPYLRIDPLSDKE